MVALLFAVPGIYAQQQNNQAQQQGVWQCPRMRGGGQGGWYCPWYGTNTGHGMMQGRGAPQQYAPGQTPGKPLTQDQAKLLLENYLKNVNNPNLKLGSIISKDGVFEAQIVTKDGSLVDKLEVSKDTGWFRSAY